MRLRRGRGLIDAHVALKGVQRRIGAQKRRKTVRKQISVRLCQENGSKPPKSPQNAARRAKCRNLCATALFERKNAVLRARDASGAPKGRARVDARGFGAMSRENA